MDYKATLHLPTTDFPMKANLPSREPAQLALWAEQDIYQKVRQRRLGCPQFILHDGPPYANGDIHIGHAVNKILKDIIIKAKSLSGFDAPFVPGWDCHGLPIEHQVEKKKGKAGQKIDFKAFRQACREYALSQVDQQKEDFIRLGILGDWHNPYLTLSPQYEAQMIRAVGKIVANGYWTRGFKPVYWSIVGQSALADAEVEYHEKTSCAIDVRFEFKEDSSRSVIIWTTTPWTLPSNQAVAIHPDIAYVWVFLNWEGQNQSWLLAEALVESAMARYGIEQYTIQPADVLAECLGKVLKHPFLERDVSLVKGAHVTDESGTGAVHIAPDHGVEDFEVGQAEGISCLDWVDARGIYRPEVPILAGQHIEKVEEAILDLLRSSQSLICFKHFKHSYPHCWRTKTPLIYRATPQWFIDINQSGLKEKALKAIQGVKWIPESGQQRMASMLKIAPDWCVSRQRVWGVPIPFWLNQQTGQLHPDTLELLEKIAQRMESEGLEAWHNPELAEALGVDLTQYEPVSDTLDVWFDSGVSHMAVLSARPDLTYPADLYLEGSDQHRGWFQSSLKTAIAIHDSPPYRQVLTHGFTVDGQGRKMSKSLGNTVSPQAVVNQLGADVLRLWVATVDYQFEMTVSDEILKRVSDYYRRIRNTARFLLANLADFEPEQHLDPKGPSVALDQWLVLRAQAVQEEVIQAFEAYDMVGAFQAIHHFCNQELSAFYLDVIKDRQYTLAKNAPARRSAQQALYHVMQALVRWIAPILSFTADEIWSYLPTTEESVFLSQWYQGFPQDLSEKLPHAQVLQLMQLKDWVNQKIEVQRKEGILGSSLEAEVELHLPSAAWQWLAPWGDELRFVFICAAIRVNFIDSDLDEVRVVVSPSKSQKCVRCWHFVSDVGVNMQHPELCLRCVSNVEGLGEERLYA
jgi:isoleucyl-tRNA synthetase